MKIISRFMKSRWWHLFAAFYMLATIAYNIHGSRIRGRLVRSLGNARPGSHNSSYPACGGVHYLVLLHALLPQGSQTDERKDPGVKEVTG